MKAPYSYAPALPAMAGMIAGIVAWHQGSGLAGIILALGAFTLLYALKRHYVSFIFLFAAIGMIMSMAHSAVRCPQWVFEGQHTFTAEVSSAEESTNSYRCLIAIVAVDGAKCPKIPVLLTVRSLQHPIETGAIISVKGTLTPVEGISMPEVPHETDYQRYLSSEGISATLAVNTVAQEAAPGPVQQQINRVRDGIFNDIVMSPIEGNTASFLLATLLGDDTYILPTKYDEYRKTGVAHILALSGMHVGIIVTFVSFMLFPLISVRRGRAIRSLLSVAIIWAYTIIVGFTPSIVRAAVMVTVFVAARHIGRGYSTFNSLFLSVIIILCINPRWLYSPGFQLSVAAVSAILMFGDIIPLSLKRRPIIYYALNILVIPIAAMLGTGIVSAYYFNTFAGMFLLGNIVTGIVFPWILTAGVILTATTAMGIKFSALGTAVDWLYRLMETAISEISSYTWAEASGIFFSPWVILPYSLALITAALAVRQRKLKLWLITAVLLVSTIITERLTRERIPSAEVYVTRSTQATYIIMRTGHDAWLYTNSNDIEGSMSDCADRYRGFLQSRGCGDRFTLADTVIDGTYINKNHNCIEAAEKRIYIIDNDSDDICAPDAVQYLLLNGRYKGDIAQVVSRIHPDTIVIAGNMHNKRRNHIIGYCSDSIPCIDLRHRGISIVIAK